MSQVAGAGGGAYPFAGEAGPGLWADCVAGYGRGIVWAARPRLIIVSRVSFGQQ